MSKNLKDKYEINAKLIGKELAPLKEIESNSIDNS